MTITVSGNWKRAMERALGHHLKPTKHLDGTYSVPSASQPGTRHTITLDEHGHIVHCSGCKGWERYGRSSPCWHAGAVALARIYELGAHINVARPPLPVIVSRTTRSQLYRSEDAA